MLLGTKERRKLRQQIEDSGEGRFLIYTVPEGGVLPEIIQSPLKKNLTIPFFFSIAGRKILFRETLTSGTVDLLIYLSCSCSGFGKEIQVFDP